MREEGDFRESVELLRTTYEKYREAVPGEDLMDSLRTAKSLAVSLRKAGLQSQAIDLTQETYDRYLRNYPRESPDVLACALNLACDYSALNDKSRACQIVSEVKAAYQRTLPEDHPYTLVADNNLVTVSKRRWKSGRGSRGWEAERWMRCAGGWVTITPFTMSPVRSTWPTALGDSEKTPLAQAEGLERETLGRLRDKARGAAPRHAGVPGQPGGHPAPHRKRGRRRAAQRPDPGRIQHGPWGRGTRTRICSSDVSGITATLSRHRPERARRIAAAYPVQGCPATRQARQSGPHRPGHMDGRTRDTRLASQRGRGWPGNVIRRLSPCHQNHWNVYRPSRSKPQGRAERQRIVDPAVGRCPQCLGIVLCTSIDRIPLIDDHIVCRSPWKPRPRRRVIRLADRPGWTRPRVSAVRREDRGPLPPRVKSMTTDTGHPVEPVRALRLPCGASPTRTAARLVRLLASLTWRTPRRRWPYRRSGQPQQISLVSLYASAMVARSAATSDTLRPGNRSERP